MNQVFLSTYEITEKLMKVVLSHPTANANVRAAANSFLEADALVEFHTSIAVFSGSILDHISRFGPFSELRRRKFNKNLQPFTYAYPWYELGRQLSLKGGLKGLIKSGSGVFSVDAGYRKLDKHVAARLEKIGKKGVDTVYAYEDGALETFTKAKQLGIRRNYDLPIGYWRAARLLLKQEKEKWPEWASTLTGLSDSEEKLTRKDEELKLADQIIVASQFTANTLKEFPGNLPTAKIVPYGFPEVHTERVYDSFKTGRPLKVLFVGGLSQRKGIAELFKVSNSLKTRVELTIVGLKATEECTALNKELTKHRWIPSLAHDKVLELMRASDVLVFPSLFEGFGLVITEAMSQGTPVITTERTAGPDLITHGENGWLFNAGSVEQLQNIIEAILSNHTSVAEVGRNAWLTAKGRTWNSYKLELQKALV